MFETMDLKTFGQKLRTIRRTLGHTQADVYHCIGISCDTLRRIENGTVVPRYDTLEYLSSFYKIDLLEALLEYRKSTGLYDFYKQLDTLILSYDAAALRQLKDTFNTRVHKNINLSDMIRHEGIEQFKTLLTGIAALNSRHAYERATAHQLFIDAMRQTNASFLPETFEQCRYNGLELRVLLLTAIALVEHTEYVQSNAILTYLKNNAEKLNTENRDVQLMTIKIYANLSYNYHALTLHAQALESANTGIDYCNATYSNYGLANLLFRKGIALYHLEDKHFSTPLQQSIVILEATGKKALAQHYKDIAKKNYDLSL